WTDLQLGGELVVLAGGGGGSGSGRATADGSGGQAGVSYGYPTVYIANNGGHGRGSSGGVLDSGGRGGAVGGGAGSGGPNPGDPGRNGSAGSGRTGGAGGPDADLDSGGGGGGGFYGGGGGASTLGSGSGTPAPTGITGAGGGGGASYVSPTAPDGSASGVSVAGGGVGETRATAGDGADGSVTLTWVPCLYELAVEKSADVTRVPVGSPITWSVTVRHVVTDAQADSPMTRGDVLTIRDTLPGSGPATITSISTVPGDPQLLDSGPITCSAGVGDPMPATLVCSRPYSAPLAGGAPGGGVRGLDRSESITVTYVQNAAGPVGILGNTASVQDRTTVDGGGDNSATAEVEVVVPGVLTANPDVAGGSQGLPVEVDPVTNDVAGGFPIDPTSVTLLDADGNPVPRVTVPGQGTYSMIGTEIVFRPLPGFFGTANPVTYRITDEGGLASASTFTPTIRQSLFPDTTSGPQGVAQSVDPLANDESSVTVPGTLTLLDGTGDPVESLVVPAQGTYTIAAGRIVFTPVLGFVGSAEPVPYRVNIINPLCNSVARCVDPPATSAYTPTVTPVRPGAAPDTTTGPQGVPQSVDPLANDVPGNPAVPLDPATLTSVDDAGEPVESVTVPGQGSYTVAGGRMVFTPLPDFSGTADPVTYRVADVNGTTDTSTYTPTVLAEPTEPTEPTQPGAPAEPVDDTITVTVRAPAGTTVVLDPSDDIPGLVPSSLRLVGPDGEPATELVVAGQGTWSVDTATGLVTFTPEPGFTGDPDPVRFTAVTDDGAPVTGELVVDYYQPGAPLAQTGTSVAAALATALLLVVLGAALLRLARRHSAVGPHRERA
ncbi:MAG: Ig-like domain-containing protein, partial [Phycicoccus sp.]